MANDNKKNLYGENNKINYISDHNFTKRNSYDNLGDDEQIRKITINNQVNKIQNAYRNYIQRKHVRFSFFINLCDILAK